MSRKWGIAALSIFLLLVVVVAASTWYLRNNPVAMSKTIVSLASRRKEPATIPLELSEEFDPSVNAAMYTVDSLERESEILVLKLVWPQVMSGKVVKSKISCIDGAIQLHMRGEKSALVSKQELFDKIEAGDKASMIFSGLCNDKGCGEMINRCSLTVPAEGKI